MRLTRVMAASACVALLAGCTVEDSGLGVSQETQQKNETNETVARESEDTETSIEDPTPLVEAGPVAWELPRSVYYGPVLFTIDEAERRRWLDEEQTEDDDEDVDWVVADLTLENTAIDVDWSFPAGVVHLITADGTRVDGVEVTYGETLEVQSGNNGKGQVAFEVDADTDLAGATLSIYETDRHPAVIALDGPDQFVEDDTVEIAVSPTSIGSAAGNPQWCALGNMGGGDRWDLTEIQAFATRNMPLTPEKALSGAGNHTAGPGGGSGQRAAKDSVLLVIRMKVGEYEVPNGATGCTPSLSVDADGQTVDVESFNLSSPGDYLTTTNGTNLIQFAFDVPTKSSTIDARFTNPPDLDPMKLDTSFLEAFRE